MQPNKDTDKSKIALEYELRLTKEILARILELNKDKDLIVPQSAEIDSIEEHLKNELEKDYPKFRINIKK